MADQQGAIEAALRVWPDIDPGRLLVFRVSGRKICIPIERTGPLPLDAVIVRAWVSAMDAVGIDTGMTSEERAALARAASPFQTIKIERAAEGMSLWLGYNAEYNVLTWREASPTA